MIQAQLQTTADGAIVFDPVAAAQAGGAIPGGFDPDWFEAGHWRALGAAESARGGRGGAIYLDAPFGRSVLRHYRRGGMVAGLLGDRYLWTRAERTRGFAEFRLLAELHGRGLPVPAPVAARYRRDGVHYRADLITRRIEGAVTLAELVADGRCDAQIAAGVGATVAEFHAGGACHADLNAHNVLLVGEKVWLVDFDRGQLRTPVQAWQLANLWRLRRSLLKLGAARDGEPAFDRALWKPLMAAYERRLGEIQGLPVRSARA
ncbi:MAG: 3-deoxy-D-manno-octulosonic acid kinase [Rudaea sp.]|nr:3-deoxy-D-manno-octulosonic acid kinase [Rudaea sp.]